MTTPVTPLAGNNPVATDNPLPVALVATDGPVTINLTGAVSVDTLGALNDAKVTNPDAASATLPSLARGQLSELVAILAKLSADPATQTTLAALVSANHTDLAAIAGKLDTIITALGTANGHLATIATNTTPVP